MDISVIIATRNRFSSLVKTVQSIEDQTYRPFEIIIVDASDQNESLPEKWKSSIPIKYFSHRPSVCAQRNYGIKKAVSEWIFICDDDIELDKIYFEELVEHCKANTTCGAAAGLLLQKENGVWVKNYPVKSFAELIWKYAFQLSIWGEIELNPPTLLAPFYKSLKKFYRKRENTMTLGGWPLITEWGAAVMKTKFYSLGATLVRKEWLLNSPFDETLDAHGIGDNYGVALGFPGEHPIHVLSSTCALHHKVSENRLNEALARSRRIIALNHFLSKKNSSLRTRFFFVWSSFSYVIFSLIKDRKNFVLFSKTFLKCLVVTRSIENSQK
jgi:glycosyltransferase involved in cell wall biosynthesis